MWKTVIRRFLIMIPQLIAISLFMFILAANMPGDAISGLISPDIPMAELERLREDLGLNQPWYVRYVQWVGGLVRGDFGQSFAHFRPVSEIIGERILITFFLSLYSLILTYLLAVPLGVLAGKYSGLPLDKGILIYVFLMMAVPTIVICILLVLWFSPIGFGWFPLGGTVDSFVYAWGTGFEIFRSRVYHFTLPAIAGALVGTLGVVFMLRSNIIERKVADYVTFARSKGVPNNVIFFKHILRNSIIPLVAGLGLAIAFLFGGAVFIEMAFRIPGMGDLFITSINRRDFPVANILIMFTALLTVVGVLLSDIFLTIVDPRMRIR